MAVTLKFDAPTNYNLVSYEIGESVNEVDPLSIVASGANIGDYPEWINSLTYSGSNENWYSVRFITDDTLATAWAPRMHGKYGAGIGYFIERPVNSDTIYLIPPPSSGTAEAPVWLDYNTEYTITIDSSGLYGDGTDYMLEDYSFFFTAEYCPLWSSVENVRLTVGPSIDGLPDDTINRMIHKASLRAVSQFLKGVNPYGCTLETVPEPLVRWVTCMAGLHALNAAVAGGGTGGGNTSKHLGSMSISYGDGDGGEGTSPGDIRKSLNDCIVDSATLIGALMGTMVQSTVHSLNNGYIQHPFRDKHWGRLPRKIEDNGTTGPWENDDRDHVTVS